MTDLTRAQKTRLGLFILLALGLFVLAALVKIGPKLFGDHDLYHVRMPKGVGGLQAGATVTLNGLVVGSVERLGIDPNDVWAEMARREQLFGIAEKLPKDLPKTLPKGLPKDLAKDLSKVLPDASRRKVVTLESRRVPKRH